MKFKINKRKTKKFKADNKKHGFVKLLRFLKFKFFDIKAYSKKNNFNEYGLTLYCGMQGYGKTISDRKSVV